MLERYTYYVYTTGLRNVECKLKCYEHPTDCLQNKEIGYTKRHQMIIFSIFTL